MPDVSVEKGNKETQLHLYSPHEGGNQSNPYTPHLPPPPPTLPHSALHPSCTLEQKTEFPVSDEKLNFLLAGSSVAWAA